MDQLLARLRRENAELRQELADMVGAFRPLRVDLLHTDKLLRARTRQLTTFESPETLDAFLDLRRARAAVPRAAVDASAADDVQPVQAAVHAEVLRCVLTVWGDR